MKHLNFLVASLLLLSGGVNSVVAQTDVTDTYLKNPGFEDGFTRFFNIKNTDSDKRGVEKPTGWSVEWYQDGKDSNGMTFVSENMNQDNVNWTAKSGSSYFARMRWETSTLYLRQTLRNLKPGKYTLSFYAAGFSEDAENNTLKVNIGGKTQIVETTTTDVCTWKDYSIDFEMADNEKYATIEVVAQKTVAGKCFKIGVDEFKLTYDGTSYYQTLIEKAKALYNDNKDWAKDAETLNSVITANSEKTDISEINEAIGTIEKAMTTFKQANTVDVTSKIVNPNFDSDISGWTCAGGDGNNYQYNKLSLNNVSGGALEKWRNAWNGGYNQKNFEVSQKLTALPKGEYTIKAAIWATMQGVVETLGAKEDNSKHIVTACKNKKHGGPYYIDDEHGVWLFGTSGENTDMDWANTENKDLVSDAGAEYRTAVVNVQDGNLTIGVKGFGSENGGSQLGTYANWVACDNWTISYFGFDPTTLLSQISNLKNEAAELLNSEEYKNVIGSERTDLEGLQDINPAETKTELDAAVAKIESAIAAFKDAKSSYENLLSEQAKEETTLAYASKDKFTALTNAKAVADATSKSDAEAKIAAIIAARRAYVESNGLAEGVEGSEVCSNKLQVTVADKEMPGISYSEIRVNNGEGATDSEGNKTQNYFDTSGAFWGSDSKPAHMTQDLTGLKAGKYLLTVQARGASILNKLELTAGSNSMSLSVQTPTNLYGNNWDDYSLETVVGKNGDLTIKIAGQTNKKESWFSFNNFRLVRLGDLDAVTLDEAADNTIAAGLANVTLTRTLAAGMWNTMVLPFDLTAEEVATVWGDDVKVAKFSNEDAETINFATGDNTIKANVPVLIKPATVSEDNTYTFDGVTLQEGEAKAEGTNYSFVGSYSPYNLVNDDYMLYKDKWWKTEDGDSYKIKAFRAYIKANDATQAAKSLNLVIDGQTTGLKLNTVTGDVDGETYNLAGQRVADSFKGIVVKNGKKVINK